MGAREGGRGLREGEREGPERKGSEGTRGSLGPLPRCLPQAPPGKEMSCSRPRCSSPNGGDTSCIAMSLIS